MFVHCEMVQRIRTLLTHRIYNLPIVVLMPHSSCNCRCVMCDIWKANHLRQEISLNELEKHVSTFRKLNVREVVFSGGEALMHSNLWNLCALLKKNGIRLTLLSTGLLLQKNAEAVIQCLDKVIVSVDGSRTVHDRIRNIPNGYEKLSGGVAAIKKLKEDFPVTARCVLQRHNFADYVNTVRSAKTLGVDQISFLAADISTPAFNRDSTLPYERAGEIALNTEETDLFENILQNSFRELQRDYRSRFIAESPEKMMNILRYYRALNGKSDFRASPCNAPWVSAVIESNGDVMPCFFHKPYGNIYNDSFIDIINSREAVSFRKNLKVAKDGTCRKCVCSLKIGITQMN